MQKVMIGCPIGKEIKKETLDSIFKLSYVPIAYVFGRTGEIFTMLPTYNRTFDECIPDMVKRMEVISRGRNQIYDIFMKSDYDWLFWVDGDIVLYPDIIQDVFKEAPNEKVIAIHYDFVGMPPKKTKLSEEYDKKYKSNYTMGFGFGCVLISREVHEKVGNINEVQRGSLLGEDFVYAQKIRETGYNIYKSDKIKVEHLHKSPVYPSLKNRGPIPGIDMSKSIDLIKK